MSAQRKKILFLSHIPPYPIMGGDSKRISQQLSLLLEDNDVDIIYLRHHGKQEKMADYDKRIGKEWCVNVPKWRRYLQASKTLINRRPLLVNHFYNKSMARIINRISRDYDMVFGASPAVAKYMFELTDVRRILDATDSLTLNYLSLSKTGKGLTKLLHRINAGRMRRFEHECIGAFNRTIYISEFDRDYITDNRQRTAIVKNRIDLPQESDCCTHTSTNNSLMFLGKLDYKPNIDAVTYFVREVMPILRRRGYEVLFNIVGGHIHPSVKALGELPGVNITGFVASLSDYFRNTTLFVAPMLSGSGVQNKILEAMAHGCCVVTTPIGATGIEDISAGLTVAETNPEIMADTIIKLLNNSNLRKEYGAKARSLIASRYNLAAITEEFSKIFL